MRINIVLAYKLRQLKVKDGEMVRKDKNRGARCAAPKMNTEICVRGTMADIEIEDISAKDVELEAEGLAGDDGEQINAVLVERGRCCCLRFHMMRGRRNGG